MSTERDPRFEADKFSEQLLQSAANTTLNDEWWNCIVKLIDQIAAGGTFVVAGPNPLAFKGPRYGCTLESLSGHRSANGYGDTIGEMLVAVLKDWERYAQCTEASEVCCCSFHADQRFNREHGL